tara:strand:+ start:804 stop:1091 length:288 start_codon:yes stop_codon:yes gene_type:complete
MDQYLLYGSYICSFVCFLYALNARGRVIKIEKSVKDLDWDSIANLTGDIATVKKTIQTLNNRMSGMNSPKIQDEQLIQQFMNQHTPQPNGKIIGG